MEALKIIPNVYFDLIARVIPGWVLLLGIELVTGKNLINSVMAMLVPNEGLKNSAIVWLVVVFAAGYTIGHGISPLVRFLEDQPTWMPEMIRKKLEHIRHILPPFWYCSEASEKLNEDYNYLRFKCPDVAALVIRIRAEYKMYGGFAVALVITLLVGFVSRGISMLFIMRNWPLQVLTLFAIWAMLHRHLQTWEHFRKTVTCFGKLAHESSSSAHA